MRILFLTHRLPYAPNRGDRARAFHLLRELSKWAQIDLVSLVHDDEEASHAGDLNGVCASVSIVRTSRIANAISAAAALPTSRPTTHSMLGVSAFSRAVAEVVSDRRPDVVFAFCTGVAPAALIPSLGNVPIVLDMVDVDSAKWAAYAKTSMPPMSWVYAREAKLLARFEQQITRRAAATLVVSDREKKTLTELVPGGRVVTVGLGVDAEDLTRPDSLAPSSDPAVVFCGVMNYRPNVEGVVWFAKEAWPIVRRRVPGARFDIVGSKPTPAVRALASSDSAITVTGWVDDVRPYLWGASVAVAPLLTARGVQNKVLEAVAAGLPAVVTPVVAEGLPEPIKPACLIASGREAVADAVARVLLETPAERRQRVASADLNVLSWTHQLAEVRSIVEQSLILGRYKPS